MFSSTADGAWTPCWANKHGNIKTLTCLWRKDRRRVSSMPCTNKDSRSEPKPTPRLIISFLQMRIGGQWTCICLIMKQMAALSLKEKLIRRIRSAGRVISARRKCPASLRRHKSLSIQDMLLMTMISEMCLPYAAVFISPFQMNICLMQINPKSPK